MTPQEISEKVTLKKFQVFETKKRTITGYVIPIKIDFQAETVLCINGKGQRELKIMEDDFINKTNLTEAKTKEHLERIINDCSNIIHISFEDIQEIKDYKI